MGEGDGFDLSGYNDKPKRCPDPKCGGIVYPTWNANVGRCGKCGEQYGWSGLKDQGKYFAAVTPFF